MGLRAGEWVVRHSSVVGMDGLGPSLLPLLGECEG
jgi:hypothetical protein